MGEEWYSKQSSSSQTSSLLRFLERISRSSERTFLIFMGVFIVSSLITGVAGVGDVGRLMLFGFPLLVVDVSLLLLHDVISIESMGTVVGICSSGTKSLDGGDDDPVLSVVMILLKEGDVIVSLVS